MSDIRIEALNENNLSYLADLFKAVYKKNWPSDYFKNKYDTAYTGVQYIGYFAMSNNKPVAYYGVTPVFVLINGLKVLAAQSCDTMTHPEYRKRGLFIQLAELTFGLARQKGIAFVFGFPNEKSYIGLIKHLGFKHQETLRRFTLDFGDTILKKVLRKCRNIWQNEERPEFKNVLLDEGFDGLLYNEDFLKYKKYNQNFFWTMEGNTYWITGNGHLYLGAFSSKLSVQAPDILNQIAKRRSAAAITYLISENTALENSLSGTYKSRDGFALAIKDLSGKYPLDNLKFQFADIDIF